MVWRDNYLFIQHTNLTNLCIQYPIYSLTSNEYKGTSEKFDTDLSGRTIKKIDTIYCKSKIQ